MERPLIPLLCAFISGITTGHFCRVADTTLEISLFLTLILLLAAAIKKTNKLIAILVILSLFLLGILNVNMYLYQDTGAKHIINYVGKEKLILEGVICENPESSPDRTALTVSVRPIPGSKGSYSSMSKAARNSSTEMRYDSQPGSKSRTIFRIPGGLIM